MHHRRQYGSKGKLDTCAILGIIMGVVVVILLCILLACNIPKMRRSSLDALALETLEATSRSELDKTRAEKAIIVVQKKER